jgi:membrane associated rhomboid family serine protease
MARNPTVLALPPFYGVVKRVILTAVAMFLLVLVLAMFPGLADVTRELLKRTVLDPDRALGPYVWEFVTYSFVGMGLLSLLFAALSLWMFGARLEDERGSLWMGEYFFTATIGGGLLACLLSRLVLVNLPDIGKGAIGSGLWPAVMAVMLAYARFHPDEEISLYFLFRLRVKYLVAIYLLVYLAMALTSGGRFEAVLTLCAAGSGFLYLKFAPRRGLRFAGSEWMYGLRNAYYKRKRQRAAKKFTVYMKKQGKDVSLDASGKYVSIEDEDSRGPNDKHWMN